MDAAPRSAADQAGRALAQADALLRVGRHEEALAHVQRAAAIDPEDPRPHLLSAAALLNLGRPSEAVAAASRAVGLAPGAEAGHRLRALALTALRLTGEARAAALEAARLDPESAGVHVVLAGALQADGDEAGALAAARHAVKLAPESPDTHDQLGRILLAHDRPAEAEQAFRTALALNPESPAVLNNLSIARARQGAHDEALRGFERATGADPRLTVARANVLRMAERARWWRRLAALCALIGLFVGVFAHGGSRWGVVVMLLVLAVGLEVARWRSLAGLTPTARTLVADDARARRLDPRRWDWKWPTRLRPWWWILLQRLPTGVIVPVHVLLLVASVAARLWVWVVLLGLALPFSAHRVWKAWRRVHPGRGSWRPPAP